MSNLRIKEITGTRKEDFRTLEENISDTANDFEIGREMEKRPDIMLLKFFLSFIQ